MIHNVCLTFKARKSCSKDFINVAENYVTVLLKSGQTDETEEPKWKGIFIFTSCIHLITELWFYADYSYIKYSI